MNCYYYVCLENAVSVDLSNQAIKCWSKKELYVILQSDCGVYMPPIEFANADYWRRIVTGKAKVVHLLQLLFCIVRKAKRPENNSGSSSKAFPDKGDNRLQASKV